MPKVNTRSLRRLANKVPQSILTGAINESANYVDELEEKVEKYEKALREIAESNEDTPFSRHLIFHARRTINY